MKNSEKTTRNHIATVAKSVLDKALFVFGNTNSCAMVYQPKAPKNLSRFSKVK